MKPLRVSQRESDLVEAQDESRRQQRPEAEMVMLKTIGIAQTSHRGLLVEAGCPVNVVVTQPCWDALIKHKDLRREATRVWDLLFSTRLHLGGGIGGGPIARAATFEVACGRKVGIVTAQTCTDCILISLSSENVSLPAKDHNGLLEAMQ